MTIKTNLTESDYRAFYRHVAFRYRKLHWIMAVPVLFIALSSWFGGKPEETTVHRLSVLMGSILVLIILMSVIFTAIWLVKRITRAKFAPPLGAHIFEISLDGIMEENETNRVETKVAGIRKVDERAHHFFVITKSGLGHILPKRDVSNHAAIIALKDLVDKAAQPTAPAPRP